MLDRDVDNVTIRVGPGVEVSGSLKIDSDVPTEAKLEEINIGLAPQQMGQMMYAMPGRVNAEGGFQVTNASSDTFMVRAMGMPQGFYLKSVRLGEVDVLEHGLNVSGTPVSGLEVVMSPKAAEVTGTVINKEGKPLQGAVVVLHPQFGKQRLMELQKVISSDQNGGFRLRGVVPGEYKLYAFEAVDAFEAGDLETLKEHEAKAVTLSLKEGAREAKELKAILLQSGQ